MQHLTCKFDSLSQIDADRKTLLSFITMGLTQAAFAI